MLVFGGPGPGCQGGGRGTEKEKGLPWGRSGFHPHSFSQSTSHPLQAPTNTRLANAPNTFYTQLSHHILTTHQATTHLPNTKWLMMMFLLVLLPLSCMVCMHVCIYVCMHACMFAVVHAGMYVFLCLGLLDSFCILIVRC